MGEDGYKPSDAVSGESSQPCFTYVCIHMHTYDVAHHVYAYVYDVAHHVYAYTHLVMRSAARAAKPPKSSERRG